MYSLAQGFADENLTITLQLTNPLYLPSVCIPWKKYI